MLGSTNIVAFVPIKDSEKARAFYEGVLGLRFVKDEGFAMVLDANGIMIRAAKVKDFTPALFTILGWQVSDIENMVRALGKKGVHFEIFGFFKQDELGIWTAPTGDKVACLRIRTGMCCQFLSTCEHGSGGLQPWTILRIHE